MDKTLQYWRDNNPFLVPAIIRADRGHMTYDVSIDGRLIQGVHCCLPFDGIYAEITGQEVWVYLGGEPTIIGIRYPLHGGLEEGAKKLRRVHMMAI